MEAHKIKVDGRSIHAGEQQTFETYVILSSDQDCDPGMVDYEHPSTWPENWPPNTGDAYLDKSFKAHCDYLYQIVPQAISGSFSDDCPPFSSDGVMGALLNVQLPGYGHLTQAKEPSYHCTCDVTALTNFASLQSHDRLTVAEVLSKYFGFHHAWPLINSNLFWVDGTLDYSERLGKVDGVSMNVMVN